MAALGWDRGARHHPERDARRPPRAAAGGPRDPGVSLFRHSEVLGERGMVERCIVLKLETIGFLGLVCGYLQERQNLELQAQERRQQAPVRPIAWALHSLNSLRYILINTFQQQNNRTRQQQKEGTME